MAEHCASLAHYAAEKITALPGYSLVYPQEFFMEFAVHTPVPVKKINEMLDAQGILGGLEIGEREMLMCVTEANTMEQIDAMVKVLKEAAE